MGEQVSYTAVVDIIAEKFQAERTDYIDLHGSNNQFSVDITMRDGSSRNFSMELGHYTISFSFPLGYMEREEMAQWMQDFEYSMEQQFLKDIKVSWEESDSAYRVKISY
jgi:hypothetical protein